MAKDSPLWIGTPGQPELSLLIMKLCGRGHGHGELGFCGKCMDFKQPCHMFKTLKCGHNFCNYCMHEHVASNLRENTLLVKCPDKDCKLKFGPKRFRSILPLEVLHRWEHVLIECNTPIVENHVEDSIASLDVDGNTNTNTNKKRGRGPE